MKKKSVTTLNKSVGRQGHQNSDGRNENHGKRMENTIQTRRHGRCGKGTMD